MASKEADFSERDLSGFKYLDRLLPMLARLHDFGCARDRAGNRQLHYDQYCLLVLLALFNPAGSWDSNVAKRAAEGISPRRVRRVRKISRARSSRSLSVHLFQPNCSAASSWVLPSK